MKNKKIVIIFIVIVIIVAILTGTHKIMNRYMFKQEEIKIKDGKETLLRSLKNIENYEEKEEKVKIFLDAKNITEEEAKEILKK